MIHPSTIAGNYKVFSDTIQLEKADADQREFARCCFYAGAFAQHTLLTRHITDMSEEAAMLAISKLDAELKHYMCALISGDA